MWGGSGYEGGVGGDGDTEASRPPLPYLDATGIHILVRQSKAKETLPDSRPVIANPVPVNSRLVDRKPLEVPKVGSSNFSYDFSRPRRGSREVANLQQCAVYDSDAYIGLGEREMT
jgi:hypothetical protein